MVNDQAAIIGAPESHRGPSSPSSPSCLTRARAWASLAVALMCAGGAVAQELPERPGLAARYPGDVGIAADGAVLFAEDFEGADLARWDDLDGNPAPDVQLVTEPEMVHAGRQAVQLEAPPGEGTGADLVKLLDPGVDTLYVRWYCRFAPDFDQGDLMHFVGVAGLADRWQLGRSGEKPTGRDFFSTHLEPWRDWHRNPSPGALGFYTYYPDMAPDPSGPYYGNAFRPTEPPVLIERGRWYCIEAMVRVNTPGQADGEQAFWVDGRLCGHYRGIRWRDEASLRINCLWVLLYIHQNAQTNRVWFDDIVLATDYIGPMAEAGAP
jgi:hypothetical protein